MMIDTTTLSRTKGLVVTPSRVGFGNLVTQSTFVQWAEEALSEQIGRSIPLHEMLDGFTMPMVRNVTTEVRQPLRALDHAEAESWFEKVGATEFVFRCEFSLYGQSIAGVTLRGLFVTTVDHTPTRAPEALRADWARPAFATAL